jgi:hypothetical protein
MTDGVTPEATSARRRCLFCRRDDREPSVEHIAPAGLGLHADIVLPPGALCVPCNNLLGREVDEALVHLSEVQTIRGVWQVPDRRGRRVRELPIRNGTMHFDENGAIRIEVRGESNVEHLDPDTISVSLELRRQGLPDQWRRVTRALLKMGLELIYHQHGETAAFAPEWDPARAAILGEPFAGFLLVGPFDIHRPPDLKLSVLFDHPAMNAAVELHYGGLSLLTDVNLAPATHATEEWARAHEHRLIAIEPPGSR